MSTVEEQIPLLYLYLVYFLYEVFFVSTVCTIVIISFIVVTLIFSFSDDGMNLLYLHKKEFITLCLSMINFTDNI